MDTPTKRSFLLGEVGQHPRMVGQHKTEWWVNMIQNLHYGIFITNLVTVVIWIMLFEGKRKIWMKSKLLKENEPYEILFSFLINLIGLVAFYTCIEVQKVKYEYKFINMAAIIDEKPFKSDSATYYIGNTTRYLFIYHSIENVTDVIPIDRITKISFGEVYYIGKPKNKTTAQ